MSVTYDLFHWPLVTTFTPRDMEVYASTFLYKCDGLCA